MRSKNLGQGTRECTRVSGAVLPAAAVSLRDVCCVVPSVSCGIPHGKVGSIALMHAVYIMTIACHLLTTACCLMAARQRCATTLCFLVAALCCSYGYEG